MADIHQATCAFTGRQYDMKTGLRALMLRYAQGSRFVSAIEVDADPFTYRNAEGEGRQAAFTLKVHRVGCPAEYWQAVEYGRSPSDRLNRLRVEEANARQVAVSFFTKPALYALSPHLERAVMRYAYVKEYSSFVSEAEEEAVVGLLRDRGRLVAWDIALLLAIPLSLTLVTVIRLWKQGLVEDDDATPIGPMWKLEARNGS